MCNKREHVDRSLPNEDTKFQYCTIKHHVANKCFCMHSFCRSSEKHIVSSRQQSSVVLKMNWQLQKCSKCCKKCTIMNVHVVLRTFSNSMVSFAMAERAWMIIQEQGAPKPVEHGNTSQKYALIWQMIDFQRSECWPNNSTLIKKPFVKLLWKI